MQIRPTSPPTTVRFGENTLYKKAYAFLEFHNTQAESIEKAGKALKEGTWAHTWNGMKKNAAETFFKQDYHDMSALGPFGRIIVNNPKGAILAIVSAMIGGRLVHALERAPKLPDGSHDYRELRDIAIRDVTTCALVFFALHPVTEKVGAYLQNHRGIELRHVADAKKQTYSHMKTYSELVDEFSVRTESRLKQILSHGFNHSGMKNAIDQALKNPHLTEAGQEHLQKLKTLIQKLGTKPSATQLQQAAQKGFGLIQALDADRLRAIHNPSQSGKTLLKPLSKELSEKVPEFAHMFANYARNSRVGADAFSLALMVGILGWGIPSFNEWYTEREFKKRKSQTTLQPTEPVKAPKTTMAAPAISNGFQTTPFPMGYQYSPWTTQAPTSWPTYQAYPGFQG